MSTSTSTAELRLDFERESRELQMQYEHRLERMRRELFESREAEIRRIEFTGDDFHHLIAQIACPSRPLVRGAENNMFRASGDG